MMKHTKHLLVLWAALLLGAGNAWGAPTGAITSHTNIVSGQSYYIGATISGTDKYLSLEQITAGTGIAGSKVATTDDATVFTFVGSGTSWTIQLSNGNYLTLATSKDNGKVNIVTTSSSWTLSTVSSLINLNHNGSYCLQANSTATATNFGSYAGTQTNVWLLPAGTPPTTNYSVQWMVDGAPWQTTQVNEGAKATPPTGTPTACSGKVFVGWSSKNIGATPTDEPGKLFTDESPNAINGADSVFYAVFATETTTGSGSGATYNWESYTDWGVTGTNWLRNNNATLPTFKYTPTYAVSKIVLNVRQSNATGSNSIEITIGGKSFGSKVSSLSGTKAYDITFEEATAMSGEIVITCTNTSGRGTGKGTFYLNSITVYESGSTTTYSDYITQCSTITYIVTYDANGGTSSTTSDTYTGTPIILPTPTRDGYRFDGWEGGGTRFDAGKSYIPGSDITLTAQWTKVYIVTYDINGGTGTTPTETPKEGLETFTLARESAGFSKPGYKLAGWEDNLGNQYLFYKEGRFDYTVNNFNVTLTAIWEATHNVTYDLNGGTGTVPTETPKIIWEDFTLASSDGITKPCHTFKGWNDGTNTYNAGASYWLPSDKDLTLTAVWEALPTYTVTFKANETDVFATETYCSGDALQLPATDPDAGTYACAGYTFVGWASDEQSTETTTCPTLVSASTPITADATFHAVWKKSDGGPEQEVTFDASDISNLTELTSLSWKENTSNVTLTLSAGQRYTSGTPNTFTVTKGITNYFEVTGNAAIKKVVVEISATNYTINTVNTDDNVTISTADLIQTLIVTTSKNSVKGYASADNQIRMKKITVTCGTAYYTTSPQCCPVKLQNPVVSASVADGSVTLNWTMPADAGKVTNYTVTCVGGVTEDVTGTSYTFTGLTNCTEYTFTVRANGDGTAVCPSEVATVKATPAADSFTVTFDYGAGAGTPASWASGCGNGTSVTLPEPTTLPDNHTFEGWYDGTTLYASGDTYTPTADITLTARYTKKAGVDVVEWDPNSVTVEIGVGGAAQVQIENEVTSGSGTGKVADELFFSKYFEATGGVKLVAVYNGTGHDVDVTNYTIKYGKTSWESGYIKLGNFTKVSNTMAAGEEVILYSTQSQGDDNKIMNCVSAAYPNAPWQQVTNGNSGNSGGNGLLSFAGDKTIALYDGSTLLDVIGAITPEGAPTNTGVSMKKPSWGDAKGWTCDTGLSIEDGTEIGISTNRCLLVRKNTVKSGANAVAQNTADFATLCDEWLGQHVPDDPADNGVQASCDNFAYVGTYDYNGYYSTYQELTKVDLGGNQNADGTYTIPVSKLNDISCSKIRINVLDGSSSSPLVSSEYKVPIMVNASDVITTNAIFTKHKVADCSECDVVVLKGATLEKAPDGTADDRNEFRNMEVYAGGKLKVPTSATDLKVNKLVMRSKGDEVPVAEINGTLTIADKLYHAKRIDAARFYFFTLPYDCNVADITYYNGEVLAGRGIDHLIKYYDGAGRAIGQNAGHWEVYTGSLLEAGKGYIVAISASLKGSFESNPKKELLFPMTNALSEMTTKTVAVGTYGIGDASIGDNHKGWNLIGCPFMSNYSPIEAKGLKVGTYEDGTWDEGGKIFTYNPSVTVPYVTMPNTDGKTYTQKLASSQDLQPFRSFFVQVGKVGVDISDVAFSYANRKAPRKAPAADAAVWVELTLSNATGSDATTVIVDDDKTTDYEIGADLEKMLGYAALPQFYSLKSSTRLAFNALPSASASGAVPLGFYAPASDTYTIAMNTTQAQNLEGVYLTDNVTGTVTNLLLGDYSFTSGRTLNDARFSLAVVRSVTAVDNVLLEAVTPVVHRRTLRIDNAPVGSLVRVYDTLGREVVSEQIDAETVVYQLQMPGVYHVQIITKDSKSVYKVVSY